MCIMWSNLEMQITFLLSELINIKDAVTNNVILSALDLRAKMHAIPPIAFAKSPDRDWYEELQAELNEIDNDLRIERNRTIHDYWVWLPDHVLRIQHVAKVSKQQREKVLSLANNKPISAGEIIALTLRIAKAGGKITELRERYVAQRASSPEKPAQQPQRPDHDQDQN